jgi:hypothetical protein
MNMKETVQVMENNEMKSLYDYLGHAAGPELGKQVASVASLLKVGCKTKQVKNKKYTGKIMMYPVFFLKDYFNGKFNNYNL